MKNVKLILLAVLAMLFLGMGNVSAQEKSTVIITGHTYSNETKYKIETVKPDYEVEKKESSIKETNFFALMKKEVDYWLNQNYKLVEATSNSLGPVDQRIIFVLIKEE